MISNTVWPATIVNPETIRAHARGWCVSTLEKFQDLDIAKDFPAFVERCAHIETLHATSIAARFNLKAEIESAADRLADAELDITEASELVAQAERDGRAADVARDVMKSAIVKAGGRAAAELARAGDAIVTDTLRPLLADVIDEWSTLAPTVPAHVDDDTDAMHATEPVRVAWGRLIELEERAGAIWGLADVLRNAKVLPTPREFRNIGTGEFRWRHPELLPHMPRAHVPHRVVGFTMAIASGAGPDVLTAADIIEREKAAA